ncbi:MAG UNVERIFIED_CONTAM: Holliday junction resolvase RuvX [Rickettsiaceae bacterium]|jgi:putative Holliday junction resolvase
MIISSLQEFYKLLKPNSPIISIDYGAKKIGVAISDPDKKIAMPLEVKIIQNTKEKIDYILSLVKKYNASGIVIGLPVNMDGTSSDQSKIIENFVETLSPEINIPIFLQDERLSTSAAHSMLKSFGMKRKDRDEVDDKVAASFILETVLHSFLVKNGN